MSIPSPTDARADRAAVLVDYLDSFRAAVIARANSLPNPAARPLPSGWNALELLHHLRFVELRWLVWGFEGRPVPDPWGDQVDGRWRTSADLATLTSALQAQGAVSAQVVRAHELTEIGQPGERWEGAEPATLERILLHLVQEYARHLGHLDVVAELAGGPVGE